MVDARKLTVAQRAQVAPFHVMEVLSAAAARRRTHADVVSLAAGQPAAPPPAAVRQAATDALHRHDLGYTEQLGLPELRSAIAGHYARAYGVTVDSDDVIVTTGASGAFLLAFLSAFDAGDRVAVARPGYPAYRNILAALGCVVVDLPCDASTRFQPTVSMLEALDEPVSGLIVASPANPTGTALSGTELAALSAWCRRNGVQLISDEIYHGISYGDPLHTAWEFDPEAIVVNSFSKFWCMTGWRLGWMLVPGRLHRAADSLTGNFTICPPTLSQYAALGGFCPDAYEELTANVERYRTNRDLLLTGLPQLGIGRLAPADGAFYAYADIGHLGEDSMSWCRRLLDETGVAVVPGADFDPVEGGRFVRMSFAGRTEDLSEALTRLADWLPG
jgi:aspartate/methionine/tyrosine aminotransferase